jgi:mannose-6-phosphate isomerase-like protein (cupin superfamily)
MQFTERRSFLKALFAAVPAAAISDLAAAQTTTSTSKKLSMGIEVPVGQDRFQQARSIGVSSTTYKVSAADTAGALFVIEHFNTKPGGPPRHLHYTQDEFWYVLAGEYIVEIGSDRYHVHAGDCVLGPRNVPHAFAFAGGPPGRILILFTPAGRMEEFFALQRKPGEYNEQPALWKKYGMKLLGPPLSL